MIDSLDAVGGTGLAAPQIGVSERVVIYFVPEHRVTGRPGDDPVAMTVLVNPEIHPMGDGTYVDWEGCLSIPGMRGRVPRWERIRLIASDLDGSRTSRVVAGSHARTVQHECDHLDGRLYPTRMTDLGSLGFVEELTQSGQTPPRVPVRPRDFVHGQDALIRRLKRAGIDIG
jgi:peptide deformylase